MSPKTKKVYSFKKGDKFCLDQIYDIQGLGGGDWWDHTGEDLGYNPSKFDLDLSEFLICTRDIKITIIVEQE